MMEWQRLISSRRLSDKSQQNDGAGQPKGDRSEFERDFDRVVYSSAFRRLQDKTQVIPFPETDFVHTRLTHSLEASCVGRSLGKAAGEWVLQKNKGLEEGGVTASDFGSIVAAACLAHDIGNPPFGHAGEDAISHYFEEESKTLKPMIEDENPGSGDVDRKWQDLTSFEGNANGFRLLIRSGGLDLTYSSLAAYTKYPKGSLPKGEKTNVQEKKFSFFQSEKSEFETIAKALGLIQRGIDKDLKWARHPLAFLVEAADDICYNIMDLEDGIRLGYVPFEKGEKLLKGIVGHDLTKEKYEKIADEREKMGYLRAKAINALASESMEIFKENEDSIMNGNFCKSLIDCSTKMDVLKTIKDTSRDLIYNHRRVKEIEAAGFEVIPALLGVFIGAVNEKSCTTLRNKKCDAILELLPRQYLGKGGTPQDKAYDRMLNICEFVAGMTDTYATILYRKLKGISLYGRFA